MTFSVFSYELVTALEINMFHDGWKYCKADFVEMRNPVVFLIMASNPEGTQ